ncbi:MAG: tetratricopeptide repeat protein [Ignavibacteriales bacterium]|nr:tetratricopeptide repeat protein [Ignavibacteriales bacterium]
MAGQDQPKGRREKTSKEPRVPGQAVSWKMMVGFAAFLVAGVVVVELLTGTKNIPTQAGQPALSAPSANMEAMSHLNELEEQVKADPDDLQARLHLANFAHDNRFFDKAIDQYKKYLERNPSNADAIVDLGICYNDIGNFDEARRTMEQALNVEPDHLLGHFNLGIVNLRAGDLEKANAWFKKTVALAPEGEIRNRARQLLNQHTSMANP